MPTESFEYCFIGDRGDIVSQIEADEEPGSIKVMVVRDNRSNAVFAHTVPVKGAEEASQSRPLSTTSYGLVTRSSS